MPKNLKRPASVVSEPVEEADSESSKKQCSATEPLASPEVDKKLKEMLLDWIQDRNDDVFMAGFGSSIYCGYNNKASPSHHHR